MINAFYKADGKSKETFLFFQGFVLFLFQHKSL